jgi:hypothetical protein
MDVLISCTVMLVLSRALGEKKCCMDVYGYVCVFLSHLVKSYLSLSS